MGNEIDRQPPGIAHVKPVEAELFRVPPLPAAGSADEYVGSVSLLAIQRACLAWIGEPSAALQYVQMLWAQGASTGWIPEGFLRPDDRARALFTTAAEQVAKSFPSDGAFRGAGQFLLDAAAGRLADDPVVMGFTGRLPPPTLTELADPVPLKRAVEVLRYLTQLAGGLPLRVSTSSYRVLQEVLGVLERFASADPESFRLSPEERIQLEEAIWQLPLGNGYRDADPAFAASYLRQLVRRGDPGDSDFCSALVGSMKAVASGKSSRTALPDEVIHEWHRQTRWSGQPGDHHALALKALIWCLNKGEGPIGLEEADIADFHNVIGTIESLVQRQDPRAVPLIALMRAVGAVFARSDAPEICDLGARCQAMFRGFPEDWKSEAEAIAEPLLKGLEKSVPPTMFDHKAEFDRLFPGRQAPTEVSLSGVRAALDQVPSRVTNVIRGLGVNKALAVIDSIIDDELPNPVPLVDLQGRLSIDDREALMLGAEILVQSVNGQWDSEVLDWAAQLYALGWKTKPVLPNA